MTREDKIRAFAMRIDGATYKEIADALCVTKQCVQQLLTSGRATKNFACVYPRLKDWIREHNMSLRSFNSNAGICMNAGTLNTKVSGKQNLTMPEIKKILAYTGMTFEEAFGEEVIPGGDSDGCEQQAEGSAL